MWQAIILQFQVTTVTPTEATATSETDEDSDSNDDENATSADESEEDDVTPTPEAESDDDTDGVDTDDADADDADSDETSATSEDEDAPEDDTELSSTTGITDSNSITSTLAITDTSSISTDDDDEANDDDGTEEEPEEPISLTYEISSGDTLGGIAARFGLSVDALVQANELSGSDAILRIGQELTIPQGDAAIATAVAQAAEQAADEAESEPEATATPEPPAEAPISGRIIYPVFSDNIQSYDIWSTNVDGTNQVILVGNASQPQFTRDGNLFAYRSWTSSKRGVNFIDFPGGRQDLLTGFIEDGLPAWSKDGTFVISSRREGDRVPRLFQVGQNGGNGFSLGFVSEYADTLADGHLVARGCTISGDCGLWILLPDAVDGVCTIAGSAERALSGRGLSADVTFGSCGCVQRRPALCLGYARPDSEVVGTGRQPANLLFPSAVWRA